MVTISEALELIKAGFSVEDIRAMDSKPKQEEQKQEQKQEQKTEQKQEQKETSAFDERLDKLTGAVENLVETVGKLPFSFSMGDYAKENDVNTILGTIINPNGTKGDK